MKRLLLFVLIIMGFCGRFASDAKRCPVAQVVVEPVEPLLVRPVQDDMQCRLWVDSVLDRLSLKERVGQLFIYTIAPHQDKSNRELLRKVIEDPKERNTLSTYRMTFAYIGSFIALLLFMPLVNFFSGNSKDLGDQQTGWTMAVVVIAILCIILFFGCFAWTKERVKPIKEAQNPLKEDLKDLFKNKPWWILLGAGVAALVFNSIRDGATVYYFKYFVVEEDYATVSFFGMSFVLSGLYLALGQAANIIGVIAAAPVSNRIGKRNTYMWAMIIATVLSVIFYWFDKEDLIWMFVFQALISICAGSIFPLLWSMYADCADYSELKTGNRATGLIFSSSSMSQKFGWAIGTAITGWLLGFFGFQANAVQSEEAISGIKMFLSFLPAVGTILSVVFISMYPLTEKKMKDITTELECKRQL